MSRSIQNKTIEYNINFDLHTVVCILSKLKKDYGINWSLGLDIVNNQDLNKIRVKSPSRVPHTYRRVLKHKYIETTFKSVLRQGKTKHLNKTL